MVAVFPRLFALLSEFLTFLPSATPANAAKIILLVGAPPAKSSKKMLLAGGAPAKMSKSSDLAGGRAFAVKVAVNLAVKVAANLAVAVAVKSARRQIQPCGDKLNPVRRQAKPRAAARLRRRPKKASAPTPRSLQRWRPICQSASSRASMSLRVLKGPTEARTAPRSQVPIALCARPAQ